MKSQKTYYSNNQWMRWLYCVLILTVLVAAGCGGQSDAQPTQNAEPAFAIEPENPLPPALVETQPMPGSTIDASESIRFYFNQPMDQDSVESAWSVQPAVLGDLIWEGDSTLVFSPAEVFPLGEDVMFQVNVTARSNADLALEEPIQITYHTAEALQVVTVIPHADTEDVDPTGAVIASFNQPVVTLTAESGNQPAAFTLSPSVTGYGEWINTSTYIFYPDPALMGGINYTATINPRLTSAGGAVIAGGSQTTWTFSTAIPQVSTLEPAEGSEIWLDNTFTLTFNQPMDRASVAAALSLIDPSGHAIPGSLIWTNEDTSVSFQPDALLERSSTYQLVLGAEAQGRGGTAIGYPLNALFTTIPHFAVQGISPDQGQTVDLYQGSGSISISLTSPLGRQDADELFTFTPEVVGAQTYSGEGDTSIYIYGYFDPETTYTVNLSPRLVDRWGERLGQVRPLQFTTGAATPLLNIPMLQLGAQALFLLPEETNLSAAETNLNSLTVTSGTMPLDAFFQYYNSYSMDLDTYQPVDMTSWDQNMPEANNRSQNIEIGLNPKSDGLIPNLYFFQLSSPELEQNDYYTPETFLAVVSNIHLTVKTSPGQALIWAVDLRTGEPAVGKPVTVYSSWGALIASGVTDENGLVALTYSTPPEGESDSIYVVVSQPGMDDFSLAAPGWNNGISAWDFGLPYTGMNQETLVYLYTDRPLYQPGQEVHFRGAVLGESNGRYSTAGIEEVTVQVYGAPDINYSNPLLQSFTLPVSEYGTFDSTFTLEDDAPLGEYYLLIDAGDGETCYFQVLEYRKPEIDLSVTFGNDAYQAGDDLSVVVNADYYFGAPAGSQDITWTLYASPGYFNLAGYQTGAMNMGWLLRSYDDMEYSTLGLLLMSGNDRTDARGMVSLEFPAEELAASMQGATDLQHLVLEVTIQDESGYPTSARVTTLQHPESYYIGVHPDSWNGAAGELIGFDIFTADWDGYASGNHNLQAQFLQVTWEQNGYDPMSGYPNYEQVSTPIGSTDFITGADGRARVSFTPETPGTYMLQVTGGEATTDVMLWVGGEGSALWPSMPDQHIELRADASNYQPGDTAQIFIPNDLEGSTLALITVERGEVMNSEVVEIAGSSYTYSLLLEQIDAPNIFVSVTLIGREASGKWSFRQGYVELDVDPVNELLQISLSAQPVVAEPGSEVTLTMQVQNAEGQPVEGEFSMALVDEALLALTDPNSESIVDAFYGIQPLEVETNLSLAVYGRRVETVQTVMEAGGRGGGGGDQAAAVVREDFRDLAFWQADIVTNEEGMAQVTILLPDNLTTWVVDVRGLTSDVQVGQATLEITTNLPLMIRPSAPRFFIAGDHVRLSALVNNQTSDDLEVQVNLQSNGFTLDSPNEASQMVTIEAGDQENVTWWGLVGDSDEVTLTFTAQAGELRDAATPTQGAIPVLRYSTPQSFGTSGTLSEAGQQLEIVSLPRSFTPTGGTLSVELSPTLASTIIDGLEAMEVFPDDYTEPLLSIMLANTTFYRAMQSLGIGNPVVQEQLASKIEESLHRLQRLQSADGGWSWGTSGYTSAYLTAYVLFGLTEVQAAGFEVNPTSLSNAQTYLMGSSAVMISFESTDWELDQAAFIYFALSHSGYPDQNLETLFSMRDRLSPWASAMLALAFSETNPGNDSARSLLSDLEASGEASASGISWQTGSENWRTYSTANFSTAVVTYAMARLDPANSLLPNAVRFISAHRQARGCWNSSYESSWALMALTAYMQGTGELQATYSYGAEINGLPWLAGTAAGMETMSGVAGEIDLSELLQTSPNGLVIQRDGSGGRLYYRVYLEVERPVDTAGAVDRGFSVTRAYYEMDQDCREEACPPIESVASGNPSPVLTVRLNVTIPEDRYYVVVEDHFPAGTEVLNAQLNTTQQGMEAAPVYLSMDPFAGGWGWWYFGSPQIQTDTIRWVAEYLPAGSYQLIYRLIAVQPGEYRILPAHAWEMYFPEVEGSTAGAIFTIR